MQFSSAGTRDADPGDALTYAWDFDGNGTVDSTTPNPTHTYTTNGVYTAKLTVTDSSGAQDVKTTMITVGNTSPTITIQIPTDGDFFEWGDAIPYRGRGHRSRGRRRSTAPGSWSTFVLLHDQHGHGEDEQDRLHGLARHPRRGRVARRLHRRRHHVSYTDKGADGQPGR